jgi:DNA-binding transcriptional LysR family regulator
LTDSSDIVRKVGAVRRVLVASPDYLANAGVPESPEALRDHRLISFTALTAANHWRFWRHGEQEDATVRPSYVTNSADAAIWHAKENGGLTMALSYQVVDHLRDGRLALVMTDHEPPPYPIHIVYPSSRLLSLKVRAFLEQVVTTRDWNFQMLPGR